MATRGGSGTGRPVGTDGTDFMHRQKIASQYAISAENKKYVKYSIWMHFMLSIIVITQIIFHFGHKHLNLSLIPEVPKPMLWEYIWLTSLGPALAGFLSLNKSRLSLMQIYYKGTVFLGLGPVLITMAINAGDLMDFARTKKTSNTFHDFPIIVLWYMYLFVVIQVHAFGIYFSRTLINAWTATSNTNSNSSAAKKKA